MDLNASLLTAIRIGTADDVRSVLQGGANPNATVTLRPPADEDDDPLVVKPVFFVIICDDAADRDAKLQVLLDAGASPTDELEGYTPLGSACLAGRPSLVQILLSHGVDVNNQCSPHGTPLHDAAFHENAEICLLLLQNGADANSKDPDGLSPLHAATYRGAVDVARVLLANGACINDATNDFSLTPLHFAGVADMARLLVEHGADLSVTCVRGQTALQRALKRGKHAVVSVLMEAHGQKLLKCDHVHPMLWAHVLAKVGERSTDMSRVGINYALLREKPDLFGYKNAGRKRKQPDRSVPEW